MTAAFVNSNSLLTYIPYTALTEPFTINGMFYAIKREILEAVGGFAGLETQLADDFAVAHRFRQHGLRLAQTPLRHAIRTQVKGPAHFFNLIRRWFVAPRESILRYVGPRDQAITYSIGMVPALAPLGVLATAAAHRKPGFWAFALGYFGLNFGIFAYNNVRYLRHATPWRKAWLAPVMLVVFPFQLLFALLAPQRVNWRGNVMQIERGGAFRYLHRRAAAVK
jgi:ceramide glucosyltransferase